MNKIYILLFALIILGCSKDKDVAPGKGTWTKKNDFPGEARSPGVSFAINGKGYIVGGSTPTNSFLTEVWEYSPEADAWKQKSNITSGGPFEAAVIISGKAYVITYGLALFEYVPETDKWTYRSSLPDSYRPGLSAFSIGDAGYFGCGSNSAGLKKDFWKYQPSFNTWTQIADFPSDGRYDPITFSGNTTGYVGFGLHGTTSYLPATDLWSYNPIQNSWSEVKAPTINKNILQNSGAMSFSISNVLYMKFGGLMYAYDATTNSWIEKENFPTSGSSGNIFSIGDNAYVVGSASPETNSATKQVYQFTP